MIARCAPAAVRHRPDARVDARHLRDMLGVGVTLRIGGIEPVDVGEQDHALRGRRLPDAGGEPVIVAEADFLGRD